MDAICWIVFGTLYMAYEILYDACQNIGRMFRHPSADLLTIDGSRTIYRIEKRLLDGSKDWEFVANSNLLLEELLVRYPTNSVYEFRVKNFSKRSSHV